MIGLGFVLGIHHDSQGLMVKNTCLPHVPDRTNGTATPLTPGTTPGLIRQSYASPEQSCLGVLGPETSGTQSHRTPAGLRCRCPNDRMKGRPRPVPEERAKGSTSIDPATWPSPGAARSGSPGSSGQHTAALQLLKVSRAAQSGQLTYFGGVDLGSGT